jgi:hypothetical protein
MSRYERYEGVGAGEVILTLSLMYIMSGFLEISSSVLFVTHLRFLPVRSTANALLETDTSFGE